jgi:hypothetical protein
MTTALTERNGNGSTAIAIDETAVLRALKLDPRDVNAQAVLLVCQRYGLDPILRHMLLIEGRPYITRDGLLHVAHRSGQLDGIEVLEEGQNGGEWFAKVAVYRKDMSRPFAYSGRYNGSNKKYGPEMAIKTAEVMALRRAFDVTGVPVMEEQADKWDQTIDAETGEITEARKTAAPKVTASESDEAAYRTQTAKDATTAAWRWFAAKADMDHAAVCKRLGVKSLKEDMADTTLGAILDRLAQPATQTEPEPEPPIEGEVREMPPEPAAGPSAEAPLPLADWRSVGYADAMANKAHYHHELSAFQKAVKGQGPVPADCGDMTLGQIADAMTGGGEPPANDEQA